MSNCHHNLLLSLYTDIALLALLATFPVIGVLAVLSIGVLVLQKLRLQTRLEDSYWWMINYNDITIIREPTVGAFDRCCQVKQ